MSWASEKLAQPLFITQCAYFLRGVGMWPPSPTSLCRTLFARFPPTHVEGLNAKINDFHNAAVNISIHIGGRV